MPDALPQGYAAITGLLAADELTRIIDVTRSARFQPPADLDREVLGAAVQRAVGLYRIEDTRGRRELHKARIGMAKQTSNRAGELLMRLDVTELLKHLGELGETEPLKHLDATDSTLSIDLLSTYDGLRLKVDQASDEALRELVDIGLDPDKPAPTWDTLIAGLRVLRAAAEVEANRTKRPKGSKANPLPSPLVRFIKTHLANVFERHFKRKAKCSGGGQDEATSKADGPYFRFVREVCNVFEIKASDDTIVKYTRR